MIGLARRDTATEFTEFATVVTPRLFRSALLLCGDWQLAEDLGQTTLAKLYVAWGRVTKADNPQAYAHGTLTKTFLSHKRIRRNSETPTDTMSERFVATSDPALRDTVADDGDRRDGSAGRERPGAGSDDVPALHQGRAVGARLDALRQADQADHADQADGPLALTDQAGNVRSGRRSSPEGPQARPPRSGR